MDLSNQFKDFLLSQKQLPSKATVKNYVSDVRHFINWFESNIGLSFSSSLVTSKTLEIFKNSNSRILSPASLNRHLSSLRKFFTFLKDQGSIAVSPFEGIILEDKKQKAEEHDPLSLNKFKNYLYLNNASRSTIKNYLNDVRQFLLWAGNVTGIKEAWDIKDANLFDKIDSSLIDEYKKRLVEHQSSALTINRKLSSLRRYIIWAQQEGIIREGIFTTLNISREPKPTHQTKDLIRDYPLQAETIFEDVRKASKLEKLPPVRVFKAVSGGANYLFDLIIISPLVEAVEKTQQLAGIFRKKSIFQEPSEIKDYSLYPIHRIRISGIKKDFYAPLSVSTRYLPVHKKVIFHLRHTRPNWYKKYHSYALAHYINFAILILFTSILGYSMYQSIFPQGNQKAVLGASQYSGSRFLSFRQRLSDVDGNPITSPSSLRFSIYNDPTSSGSSLLWQETDVVNPDKDGQFSIDLGKNTALPQNLFLENSSLWLGITVGHTEELTPRQALSNVSHADSAISVQGLEPIIQSDVNMQQANVLLALDSSGNLSIGGDISHTFQAINSQFILSGNILTFSTIPGTNSNIELSPDGFGKIDLQKPLQNSTNNNNIPSVAGAVEVDDIMAILATSSGQSALTINQNGTGPLISASTSGTAKFTVDSFGNTDMAGDLTLSGISPEITSMLNNSNFSISASGTGNLKFQALSSGDIEFYSSANSLTSSGDLKISGNLNLSTSSATTTFGGISYAWPTGGQSKGYFLQTNGNGTLSWAPMPSSSGIADFAEYLKKDENQKIDYGSVLCLNEKGLVYPCEGKGSIAGVASSNPKFLGGDNLGNKSIAVGLTGVVLTKVSNMNGSIKPGDLLTSSPLPGIAMKISEPGITVGKALEPFNPNNCQGSQDNFGLVEQNPTCRGEILVLLNIGFTDPNPPLISAINSLSSLTFNKTSDLTGSTIYKVSSTIGNTVSRVEILAGAAIANLKAGAVNAEAVTTKSLSVTTDSVTVNGQNLRDYIKNAVLEVLGKNEIQITSPIAETNEIHTNVISPLGNKDIVVKLASSSASTSSSFVIQNASGSAVAVVDDKGNASFSGQLSAQNILSQRADISDASISGILRADRIIANQIDSNNNTTATSGAFLTASDISSLKIETAHFTQGLTAYGPSSFADVSVAGQLSLDTGLVLSANSINVLGGDIEFQPLKQGGVSFMSGLLYIDSEGNLKASGNAEFAKDVTVKGKFMAGIIAPIPDEDIVINLGDNNSQFVIRNSSNSAVLSINKMGDLVASGEGTFSKLSLSFVEPVLAVSPTEVVATGSAGIATISAMQKEITIDNKLVTSRSLIYITPKTDTSNLVLYLIRQLPGVSFTIGVNTPLPKDIPFNWIIVN